MYQILIEQVVKLSQEDREKLFEVVHDNVDLFDKLIPNSPFIAHIKGELLLNHPIAIAFDQWKSKR